MSRDLVTIGLLAAALFFVKLGELPLLEPDEGRNAEVGREMLDSGDWITPHFDSFPYLDKPVVFFWLVAGAFRLGAISETWARLPSACLALATALLVWLLTRKIFDRAAGLSAAIIFATTPLVIALSRLVIFDMTLTFLITVAMVSFWYADVGRKRSRWLDGLAFAAMGLATLTKGPVGFLLPLLSIVGYHALRRGARDLKRIHWGAGLAVFLVATLPWFIRVSMRHPDFPRYAFWQESLQRFSTGQARRTGSVFYYVPVYLLGLFPWSLFLILAASLRIRRWRDLAAETHKPVAFLLAWAGVVFVFFSVSRSKLPTYFLPAAVPLSILMGWFWAADTQAGTRSPGWVKLGFVTLIGTGLSIAASAPLLEVEAVRARVATKMPLSLIPLIKLSVLYTGSMIVVLAIIGLRFALRKASLAQTVLCFGVAAFTVPAILTRWATPLEAYASGASSRRLAMTILASPEKDLPLYGYYYFRTSLPFYLRRPVGLVTSGASELTSNFIVSHFQELRRQALPPNVSNGERDPAPVFDARTAPGFVGPLLIDAAELRARTHSPGQPPLLLLARNTQVGDLTRAVEGLEPLWSGWDYSVWEVAPLPSKPGELRPVPQAPRNVNRLLLYRVP